MGGPFVKHPIRRSALYWQPRRSERLRRGEKFGTNYHVNPFNLRFKQWGKSMNSAWKRTAIAASTVTCVALLSFSWSEQRGVSLGIESAHARNKRPSTTRRYGPSPYAEAVAATTSPWNYDDYICYGYSPNGYCVSSGYVTGTYARPTLFPRRYDGN